MFEHSHVRRARIFRDANIIGERAQGTRRHAAPTQSGNGQHPRIVPTIDKFFVHELDQFPFAHDRVSEIEPRKFILMRARLRQFEGAENPIVEWPVHFEFQCAHRMRDPFDIIAERVRPIVHRVNAPFVPGTVM